VSVTVAISVVKLEDYSNPMGEAIELIGFKPLIGARIT